MSTIAAISWPAFLLMGAGHGINPGMGWLFAVALGLQEREGRAVWRALPPLAAGHALSVGAVVAVAALVGWIVPPEALRWIVGGVLIGFGVLRLVRMRHPRYGGMRAGRRQLTIWSFLMATAHGAGLMVLPFTFDDAESLTRAHAEGHVHRSPGSAVEMDVAAAAHAPSATATHLHAATHPSPAEPAMPLAAALATAVHTAGYLFVTGAIAWAVYRRFGVRMLRKAWINLDAVWAVSLIGTGVVTLLML